MSETSADVFNDKPKAEHQRTTVDAALRELGLTPTDLAKFTAKNSDHRDFLATIRSIQRMVSGESRVSGEMMVIVTMLVRQHRKLRIKNAHVRWQMNEHGEHWAQLDGWYVSISPQSRGRWALSCRNGTRPEDYSPPFYRWLDSIDEAKNRAWAYIEEGMNDLAEIAHER
ncbi:hypothetical protein [Rhizobium sp. GR12]|uniref:hypothetical protein n=1 Tax=Rhizobium sp. GR12 TaxID=3053925 RepID=UPI002FBD2FAF